jgi:hypothetical protein
VARLHGSGVEEVRAALAVASPALTEQIGMVVRVLSGCLAGPLGRAAVACTCCAGSAGPTPFGLFAGGMCPFRRVSAGQLGGRQIVVRADGGWLAMVARLPNA